APAGSWKTLPPGQPNCLEADPGGRISTRRVDARSRRRWSGHPIYQTDGKVRPTMTTYQPKTILFLAANPKGTSPLRLDEEIKRIETVMERAKRRDQFRLVQKWAVTDDDLRRALLDHEPQIVHFSGHGAGDDGLAFEDDAGKLHLISGD